MLLSWSFRVALSDVSLLEILLNPVHVSLKEDSLRLSWTMLETLNALEFHTGAESPAWDPEQGQFLRMWGHLGMLLTLFFASLFTAHKRELSAPSGNFVCFLLLNPSLILWIFCSKLDVLPELLDFSKLKTRPISQASARGTLDIVGASSLSDQENKT